MKNKKVLIIFIVIVIALVLWVRGRSQAPSIRYTTATAGYSAIVDIVSAGGNIAPIAAEEVFSSLAGVVDEVYVDNGVKVDVNDNLFYVVNSETGQERTIEAPVKGTVVNMSIGDGSRVGPAPAAATANQNGSTPALLIVDTSDSTIKLQINEVDIDKVKVGQGAKITFDAVADKTFKGKVIRVDAVGANTQGVITYNVYVSVENPSDDIRSTMTANVDIAVARHERALTLPNSALRPYRGGKAVRVLDKKSKRIKYVKVEVGIVGPFKTEIIKGLSPGQTVVTGADRAASAGGPFGFGRGR